MEKQKIFWVILSVTVFVVVVLVVGLFLLKRGPDGLAASPGTSPAATAPAADSPTGIYEFGRDASSAQGDTEVLRFVIGDGGTEEPAAASESLPGASGAGSEGSAPEAAKPAAPAAVKPAAPSAAKPAATAPAAAKPAATARGPEYWIQTGSYKSQARAEELSQSLTGMGLAGRVFSYAKSGDTYFRVRVGPYTNKQEAEKFLAIVRKIQGLEASYISLVGATGSVN
jgi:cell division septation protein DedD